MNNANPSTEAMTTNSNNSSTTWTLHLSTKSNTIPLALQRDCTVEKLLIKIGEITGISLDSLRVVCSGVRVVAGGNQSDNRPAIEQYSVLADGVTVQVKGECEVPKATRDLWRYVGDTLETDNSISA